MHRADLLEAANTERQARMEAKLWGNGGFEDRWISVLVAIVVTAVLLVVAIGRGCAYAPQWHVEIEEGIRVSVFWPVLGDTLIPTNTATVRLTVWHE